MKIIKRILQGIILIMFISAPTIKSVFDDFSEYPKIFWVFYALLLILLILLK